MASNLNNRYNLYNLLLNFKRYLSSEINLTSNTVKNYLCDIRFFFTWFQSQALTIDQSNFVPDKSNIDIDEILFKIDSPIINSFKNYLITNKFPIKSINRKLSSLRKFFKYCIQNNLCHNDPLKNISNVKPVHNYNNDSVFQSPTAGSYLSELMAESNNSTLINQTSFITDINEFFKLSHAGNDVVTS